MPSPRLPCLQLDRLQGCAPAAARKSSSSTPWLDSNRWSQAVELGAWAGATQNGQNGVSRHSPQSNGETRLYQQPMSESSQSMDESNSTFLSRLSSHQSGTFAGTHVSGIGTSHTGSSVSRGGWQGRRTPPQRMAESMMPQKQVSDERPRPTIGAGFSASTTDQRTLAMLQMLADCNFPVMADGLITYGTKFLSLLFLACAAVFAYFAVQADHAYKLRDNLKPLGYVVGALVMALMALSTFLRVSSPTSLNIARVNGDWCLILHRMAMKPVVRPLRTLEAFVETFGFSSRAQMGFWGKMFGHATSQKGTMHLFFPESANSIKAEAICCSLEDPKAFFMCLRDLMSATSHHLSSIVADYVTNWDEESCPDNSPKSARDAAV